MGDIRWFVRGWINNRIATVIDWYHRWLERSPDRGY